MPDGVEGRGVVGVEHTELDALVALIMAEIGLAKPANLLEGEPVVLVEVVPPLGEREGGDVGFFVGGDVDL